MSNRDIEHMKYKNLEIKCKYKVKSRNGRKQHRPGNDEDEQYWKVNFIYAPEPSSPQAPFPGPHPNHPGTCPHNNIGRYQKETEKGPEKTGSRQSPGAQGTFLPEVLCQTVADQYTTS